MTRSAEAIHPLDGLIVVELAEGVAGAYCGKLLADLGAEVLKAERLPHGDPLRRGDDIGRRVFSSLNRGKRSVALERGTEAGRRRLHALLAGADILIADTRPAELEADGVVPAEIRAAFPRLVHVSVTPFGLTGPARDHRGSDLTAWHQGGYGYGFPGRVPDPEVFPSLNGPGQASLHLAGVVAAGAAMDGLLRRGRRGEGSHLDVSELEAVAGVQFGPILEGQLGQTPPRRIVPDHAPVPAVAILACSDGLVAISPREQHQWVRWVETMGAPDWAEDPRFASTASRGEHWDEVWARSGQWTRDRTVAEVYEATQGNRVPCLPLQTLDRVAASAQFSHRSFFQAPSDEPDEAPYPTTPFHLDGFPPSAPGPLPELGEYGEAVPAAPRGAMSPEPGAPAPSGVGQDEAQPLAGIRVVDLSWVLTGPTCTRLLAQLGAEVIKVESRKRPDLSSRDWIYPSLHTGKLSCTIDLTTAEGRELLLGLVARSDVLIENFSTGVMERLGLAQGELLAANPDLIVISSSPFGRTGPSSSDIAYGSLIQSFVGWGELARYPGEPEHQFGAIWGDPLSGMTLGYLSLALLHRKLSGGRPASRVDLSMAEAMIAALSEPLAEASITAAPPPARGNRARTRAPQGCYHAAGADEWIALTVADDAQWSRLCELIGRPEWAAGRLAVVTERLAQHDRIDRAISAWSADLDAVAAVAALQAVGIASSVVAKPVRLVADAQLWARGFFVPVVDGDRFVSGLPWLVDGAGRTPSADCPEVGADNVYVFQELLGIDPERIDRLIEAKVIY